MTGLKLSHLPYKEHLAPEAKTALFKAALSCAQNNRLIDIKHMFDNTQKQTMQEVDQDFMTTKSHQRLALTTALRSFSSGSNINLLIPDLLQSIAGIHQNPSTTPSKKVLERFKIEQTNTTHPLPSAADEKQAATMSLAQQCLFNISLGLAVSAFTAHLLDLTFDTTTILSPPFAMSLAVGLVVTTLAFFFTSSCRPFCLTSAGNTPQTKSTELDLETAHTTLGDPSDLQDTLNAADNAQLGSR